MAGKFACTSAGGESGPGGESCECPCSRAGGSRGGDCDGAGGDSLVE